MYKDQKPDIVFHLAATVGGIGVNQQNPGKFFYENAVMNLQVIHNAYLSNAEKIISIGTVSVYPEDTPIPFDEKNIWKVHRKIMLPMVLQKELCIHIL